MLNPDNPFTAEDFFRFLVLLLSSYRPLKSMAQINNPLQVGVASAERLFETMDEETEDLVAFDPGKVPEFRKKIEFRNVPPNSTVDIYTLSGELIASLSHGDEYNSSRIGTVEWNIWTYEYTEAAYGLYIYVVKTADGQKKVGKFAVIR